MPVSRNPESHSLEYSAAFWAEAAEIVCDRDLSGDSLAGPIVLVPQPHHAALLRAALAGRMRAHGVAAMRLPRILTPAQWLEAQFGASLGVGTTETRRQVELFEILRQTGWLRQALTAGSDAGGLWALARQILTLGDELSWASAVRALQPSFDTAGEAPDPAQRLRAAIRKSYGERASKACTPEAELIAGIWKSSQAGALGGADSIAATVQAFARLLAAPDAGRLPPLVAIAPRMFADHEAALVERYAQRAAVETIAIDLKRSLHPCLAQAWPELLAPPPAYAPSENGDFLDAPAPDLRARAEALRAEESLWSSARLDHVRLVPAASLEDEAGCVASAVLEWLDSRRRNIGLIALDRVVARRVRALLERAAVMVLDENGWKLSTSSAAGALMRWLELAAGSESSSDDHDRAVEPAARRGGVETSLLLDWLKSPFAWHGVDDKAALLAHIEGALRRDNVTRGWHAIVSSVGSSRGAGSENSADKLPPRAVELLLALRRESGAPRGHQPLARFFAWLDRALDATGMRAALAGDAVGATLLDLLERLKQTDEQSASATDSRTRSSNILRAPRYAFSEWRDFVADALENTNFCDRSVESPVVLCSLHGAHLRAFDAVAVVGADAGRFPVASTDSFLLTPGLRAELGLTHRDAEQHRQLLDLALQMSCARDVLVTWQARRANEPRPLAAALERLSLIHRLAFGDDLRSGYAWPRVRTSARPLEQPRPRAARLLPKRLSASGYNHFIDCPYRYYVEAMLGLAPLDELSDDAEKRDYGEIVHRILQRFHSAGGNDAAEMAEAPGARDALISRLRAVSDAVFGPLAAANGDYLGWRERWAGSIESYVDWLIGWSAGGWSFSSAEDSRRVDLALDSGETLSLHGRIDRIDRRDGNDVDAAGALAVIDYKVRSKKALKDPLAPVGEDVQLPFYRLLLRDHDVTDAMYLSVDGGKVDAVALDHDPGELGAALAERIRGDFSRIATGAPLPANGIDKVCRYCDARGLCRKGHWSEMPVAGEAGERVGR